MLLCIVINYYLHIVFLNQVFDHYCPKNNKTPAIPHRGGMAGWCSYLRFNRELINHPIEVLHDQHGIVEVYVLVAVHVCALDLVLRERYLAV